MNIKYRNLFLLILLIFILPVCVEQTRSASIWENGRFESPLRDLETIREEGHLRVVVEYNSTSYFVYRGKPMGYKYELLKELARELNVELDFYISNDLEATFRGLETGRYDLAAKSLIVTGERNKRVDFTRPLEQTRQVLVQRKEKNPGKGDSSMILSVLELPGKEIVVQKNSAFYERLINLEEEIGTPLMVVQDSLSDVEQLVKKVAEGEIGYTVCNENMARIYMKLYPGLDFSVPVSFKQNVAWAVRKNAVHLREYIDSWLMEFQGTYHYLAIHNAYFKGGRSIAGRNPVPVRMNGVNSSPFEDLIRKASEEAGWDWRLISSLIYKESGFDPQAVSFAGAAGLMQLMPETAESLGIEDVFNPAQNIRGGIQLLSWLNEQFKSDIPDEQERLKFVLASYNVGLGHVKDAQRLAAKFGKDPLKWAGHVDYYLLNKSDEKFYSDEVVRWGYCNGREPYDFVISVLRNYQTLLASATH
ncbi:MAG: transporter substrate-binding domain-containing protein [Prolixibacteraceae bacterium]